jgi:CMP-2-keto-3-deoxyoctulosonic acid synthetase
MAEEKEGFFSQIKNQVIATIGVVITAAGGIVVTNMETLFSPAQEETVQEVVVDSTANNQPNIIINVPSNQPVVKERVIVKEVPVEKKKEKEEEIDW